MITFLFRAGARMTLLVLVTLAIVLASVSGAQAMISRIAITGTTPGGSTTDFELQTGSTCTFPLGTPISIGASQTPTQQATTLANGVNANYSATCVATNPSPDVVEIGCSPAMICCVDDNAGVQATIEAARVDLHGGAVSWVKVSNDGTPALSTQGVFLFLVLAGLTLLVLRQRRRNAARA